MNRDIVKKPGEGVLTINFEPKRWAGIGYWASTAIGTLSCTECLPGDQRVIKRSWPPKGSSYPRRMTAEDANYFAGRAIRNAARVACSHIK